MGYIRTAPRVSGEDTLSHRTARIQDGIVSQDGTETSIPIAGGIDRRVRCLFCGKLYMKHPSLMDYGGNPCDECRAKVLK